MLDMSLLLVFFHAGNKLWTAGIYLVAQNKNTQKLKTNKICHADGRHNTAYFFLNLAGEATLCTLK